VGQTPLSSPGQPEPRAAEQVRAQIPIRVNGFDENRGRFQEDARSTAVSPYGARIALKTWLIPDDVIRIVNLESYAEADFRIVGPIRIEAGGLSEWGVECIEEGRDVWGVEMPSPREPEEAEAGALLECRICARQVLWPITWMEAEVLNATGIVVRNCERCLKPTYWTYADVTRRPRNYPPFADVAPPPLEVRQKRVVNTRKHRRLPLHLPIYIRSERGEEETTRTENISVGGFAVILSMELQVGEKVVFTCPHVRDGQNIEQRAECRWGASVTPGGTRKIYGFMNLP
jgi:hypothetical protein